MESHNVLTVRPNRVNHEHNIEYLKNTLYHKLIHWFFNELTDLRVKKGINRVESLQTWYKDILLEALKVMS